MSKHCHKKKSSILFETLMSLTFAFDLFQLRPLPFCPSQNFPSGKKRNHNKIILKYLWWCPCKQANTKRPLPYPLMGRCMVQWVPLNTLLIYIHRCARSGMLSSLDSGPPFLRAYVPFCCLYASGVPCYVAFTWDTISQWCSQFVP